MNIKAPKISIITSVLNSEDTVRKLIDSISRQTSNDYEFIVVDGLSEDNTLKVLDEYEGICSCIISEKDGGIYDAWNKGIRCSRGDWIAFVGADDVLHDNYIENSIDFLSTLPDDINLVTSMVNCIDKDYKFVKMFGAPFVYNEFKKKFGIAQVGALYKRSIFAEYGCFDCSFKIVGDYDYLLRVGKNISPAHNPIANVDMRNDGVSSYKNIIKVYKEVYKAKKNNSCVSFKNFYYPTFRIIIISLIKRLVDGFKE